MESGFSSNLTFLMAPIDAWLIPTIVKIIVEIMEACLVPTIVVLNIVTVVVADVIDLVEKAYLPFNLLPKPVSSLSVKKLRDKIEWPRLSGNQDKSEHL